MKPNQTSMTDEEPEVHYLGEGPVEDRAEAVLCALREGWPLFQGEKYGAHFVDPEDGRVTIVPRDVMEHLIDEGLIENKPYALGPRSAA
jgi:hypothetical protein